MYFNFFLDVFWFIVDYYVLTWISKVPASFHCVRYIYIYIYIYINVYTVVLYKVSFAYSEDVWSQIQYADIAIYWRRECSTCTPPLLFILSLFLHCKSCMCVSFLKFICIVLYHILQMGLMCFFTHHPSRFFFLSFRLFITAWIYIFCPFTKFFFLRLRKCFMSDLTSL
jgi:hypothetical protein